MAVNCDQKQKYIESIMYLEESIQEVIMKGMYRVSHMDGKNSKELSWFCFLCQTIFPFIFMVEKCVHFDIWHKKNSKISKGPPYDLAHFSNFQPNPNLQNEPN